MNKARYRKEFPIRRNVDPKVMKELVDGIAPELLEPDDLPTIGE